MPKFLRYDHRKLIVLALFTVGSMNVSTTHAEGDCVVLLHGLARTEGSMKKMAKALEQEGFATVNQSYASRKYDISTLAENAIGEALAACPEDSERISFVTHSMGGILLREYLANHAVAKLHRSVMLGPPNQGSEVVDKLGDFPGFHFINGDAGLQLGTGPLSIPNQLGPVTFDLGVIAGSRSANLILSQLIPGKDDGKVSIEHTKVEGMADHLTLPVTHTFMMKNKGVINEVIYFIRNGQFKRQQE